MTRKDALLQSCAFATGFLKSADREIRGASPSQTNHALAQLICALTAIPPTDRMCMCGHGHFNHSGTNGGPCLVIECKCAIFLDDPIEDSQAALTQLPSFQTYTERDHHEFD